MDSTVSEPAAAGGSPQRLGSEDGSAPRFRELMNPATKERIQFTATPEDGPEDIVRFNWRSLPGGQITEHVHPHQEERFTIISGEAHFTLDGQERVLGAGKTLVVPARTRHAERNDGSVDVVGIVELRPGMRSRQMHEAFAGLGAEGKTTSRGAPKSPLRLGATIWHFRAENRVTSPPSWAQNLTLLPLAALARLFGVRPYEQRWDSRIPPGGEQHQASAEGRS